MPLAIRALAPLFATLFLSSWVPANAAVFSPTTYTLANGLQIVVVPNHLAPVVNQMVWYKVGATDEVEGKTGLAHYLEHLMFRGTSAIPAGLFSPTIAGYGGSDNAFTSYDYTSYHETIVADKLPLIMFLEADRMRGLAIKLETATPELSVVMSERQERTDNNPEGRFAEALRGALLPEHPLGRPIIGWQDDIKGLTVEDANSFYKAHYAPNNAVVVISGDVEPEKVIQLAASIYGPLKPADDVARRPLPPAPHPNQNHISMTDKGVEQPQMVWQAVVPSYATDAKTAYALEVLAEVLTGAGVGVLYRDLVMDKGLASGIDADYDPDARGETVFSISLSPRPGVEVKDLDAALKDAIGTLVKDGLAAEKVEAAKARMQRAAVFARDSLMMPGYAFGMALTTGHTVADVEDWPNRISGVSVDDVNKAFALLAKEPRYVTGYLLPDPSATPEERAGVTAGAAHERGVR